MSETWITLRTFDSLPMAELARMTLSDAGIPCQLLNSEVVGMYPLLGNAIGYIPLQVPEQHLEEADQILGGESQSNPLPSSNCENCGEPLEQDGPCPMCGHSFKTSDSPTPSSEQHQHDHSMDGHSDDEYQTSTISLAGMREFARWSISAYLWIVLFSFLLTGLAILAFLTQQFS